MGNPAVNKYNNIRLNGITREGDNLQRFCLSALNDKNTPEWLSHVYQFILEWLSDEDYVVVHTSGSTGKPKEMRLLKKDMIASALKTVSYFKLSQTKTALLCLSANYIAGKMMLVRAFVAGFNLLLVEPCGSPLKLKPGCIDFIAMVPLQVYNSISYFNKDIKSVIVGGGAVSAELKNKLLSLPTDFYETYGMTETVSHVAIREIGGGDTCFKAMPKVRFKLDERGCLVIVAPDISEVEVVTNDLVDLKSNEEFEFLGRYDNVINTGGVKVIPEEVEQKILGVLNVPFVIISLPDDKLGEKVVMVLEKTLYTDLPDLSLILTKYQMPRQIFTIPQFPITETGKIKRREVQRLISTL